MSKGRTFFKSIIITLMIGILFTGCGTNKTNKSSIVTDNEEINSLTYIYGNKKSDTVIINTQGGPVPELMNDELKEILSSVNTKDYLIVNVHQSQTKKPELFIKKEISFDEAIKYDKQSVEDLYKIVKYYKDQNKKVYVLGISFGAFMTQELIAEKGVDAADKYLIMVGRLNINEMFWKGFSQGKNGHYVNGVKPVLEDVTDITEKNMYKLAAGLGRNRYTNKLDKYDLSKVTYVYGKTDEQVGKLNDKEIEFLKSKNATVISDESGHSDAIDNKIKEGLKKAFDIK
ncbi:hypothetical protein [Clostridium ganghwense]|uniref:Alpha/beta hydrolase n=1 Tax=Clostridium ganghwense TaxID=312089 RepID=A0ABT4CJX0_9CLOT|nr:hypothetical protein [Clostridium ganghwense]MCY6369350.1 hypothetical protein [Clostridium ganghwense]